jgi:hypothetical protein
MPAIITRKTSLEHPLGKAVAKTQPEPVQPTFEPVRPWMTREQMEALASKQPLISSDEMSEQINRSLGRPQGSF